MSTTSAPTWIYHFTHRDNLAPILATGALVCDQICASQGLTVRSIAYQNIKIQRARILVEAGPGGPLSDYVPFYFGPRSPMLYTYANGNVTGVRADQDEIVYFVTSIDKITDANLAFVFTDGHPIKEPRAFYDNLASLSEVDHELMKAIYWADTDDDNDRKRRRQAEFLVHRQVPLPLIRYLGVRTEEMKAWAQKTIDSNGVRIGSIVRPGWYYKDQEGHSS